MSQQLASLIERTDRVLAGLEDQAIAAMNKALERSYKELEKKLLTAYPKYTADEKPGLLANQRALLLFDELKTVLDQTQPQKQKNLEVIYDRVLTMASEEGITLSQELMSLRAGDSFQLSTAKVPVEVVAEAAKNAAQLVVGKDAAFKQEAKYIITQGLAMGQGGRKVARELRSRLGVTKRRAEGIARTEINRAQNEAAKANYKQNGIGYFQSIATADGRLCPYCGERNGNVYELEAGSIPWHVNCRCYAAPWSPHWEDLSLTDDKWVKDFREEGLEILGKQGGKPNKGPTYFERQAGLKTAPKPVWTAAKGYTADKAKLLGTDIPALASKVPEKAQSSSAKTASHDETFKYNGNPDEISEQ